MRFTWVARAVAAMAMAMLAPGASRSTEAPEIGRVVQGLIYYNRPGATLADHDADLRACFQDSASPQFEYRRTAVEVIDLSSGKTMGPYDVSWIFHLIWDSSLAGAAASKVENCMLVRGWRAVRVMPAEAIDLAGLSGPGLVTRMSPWIGAVQPPGDIVRAFANEALHPGAYTTATALLVKPPTKDHLSLRLYHEGGNPPPDPPAPPQQPKLDPAWPTKPLKPSDLSKAPPGSALIVLSVTGVGSTFGSAPGFFRVGADPQDRPSLADHAPDMLTPMAGRFQNPREPTWFVYAVPPGRWRIGWSNFLSYCLGSPSFEIKAGEAVYAGTFHIEGPTLAPDLDLAPAKAYLGGPSAETLRAAVYRNGERGSCMGLSHDYALEFPGAPFAPGYSWGGAAAAPLGPLSPIGGRP